MIIIGALQCPLNGVLRKACRRRQYPRQSSMDMSEDCLSMRVSDTRHNHARTEPAEAFPAIDRRSILDHPNNRNSNHEVHEGHEEKPRKISVSLITRRAKCCFNPSSCFSSWFNCFFKDH